MLVPLGTLAGLPPRVQVKGATGCSLVRIWDKSPLLNKWTRPKIQKKQSGNERGEVGGILGFYKLIMGFKHCLFCATSLRDKTRLKASHGNIK